VENAADLGAVSSYFLKIGIIGVVDKLHEIEMSRQIGWSARRYLMGCDVRRAAPQAFPLIFAASCRAEVATAADTRCSFFHHCAQQGGERYLQTYEGAANARRKRHHLD
jgi:hypothetical protein